MGTLLVICRGVGAMSLDYVECSYFLFHFQLFSQFREFKGILVFVSPISSCMVRLELYFALKEF